MKVFKTMHFGEEKNGPGSRSQSVWFGPNTFPYADNAGDHHSS
jgi:hypothetical protein